MKIAALYDPLTGEILNVIRASSINLLEIQSVHRGFPIFIPPDNIDLSSISLDRLDQERWLIKNSIPQEKQIALLQTDKETIIADGVDTAIITIRNLDKEQTIAISNERFIVSPADNQISIGSQIARTFTISLVYNLTCWAQSITVVAQ